MKACLMRKLNECEGAAKRALEALLTRLGVSFQSTIVDRDPPDLHLEMLGRRFAVEITSIHGSTTVGGKQWSWPGLAKELLSVGGEICKLVSAATVIPGTFMIYLPPLRRLKASRGSIVEGATRYMQTTAGEERSGSRTIVCRVDATEISILKRREEGNSLDPVALPAGGLITRHERKLAALLRHAILQKLHKLRQVAKPWLLVIHDDYGFQRTMAEWQACLPEEVAQFAALIRVQGAIAELVAGALS